MIQAHFGGEAGGVFKLAIRRRQSVVVSEGNWMVIRKVRAQVGTAHRERAHTAFHLDHSRAGADHAEGNGAIMTTEAEL